MDGLLPLLDTLCALSADPQANVQVLTALAGKRLGGSGAAYWQHLSEQKLIQLGSWNLPPDIASPAAHVADLANGENGVHRFELADGVGAAVVKDAALIGVLCVYRGDQQLALSEQQWTFLEIVGVLTAMQARSSVFTNEQYRKLIERWPTAIIMSEPSGRIVVASPDTAKLHGYDSPDELVGLELLQLVAAEERGRLRDNARKVLESGAIYNVEHMLLRRDGSSFPAEVNIAAIPDAGGKPSAIIGVARDITERRRLIAVTRALSSKVIAVHEEERFRISRELHDEIGQMLTVVKKQGEWIAAHAERPEVQREAERLAERTTEMLRLVRNMAYNLRPAVLDDLGIGCALETLSQEVARASELGCHVDCVDVEGIDPEQATALYRIAQEALANVVRHADARNFWITLREKDNRVELTIADDGKGTDGREDTGTLGIASMRERAALIDGSVEIGAWIGGGTMVKVGIPLRR